MNFSDLRRCVNEKKWWEKQSSGKWKKRELTLIAPRKSTLLVNTIIICFIRRNLSFLYRLKRYSLEAQFKVGFWISMERKAKDFNFQSITKRIEMYSGYHGSSIIESTKTSNVLRRLLHSVIVLSIRVIKSYKSRVDKIIIFLSISGDRRKCVCRKNCIAGKRSCVARRSCLGSNSMSFKGIGRRICSCRLVLDGFATYLIGAGDCNLWFCRTIHGRPT